MCSTLQLWQRQLMGESFVNSYRCPAGPRARGCSLQTTTRVARTDMNMTRRARAAAGGGAGGASTIRAARAIEPKLRARQRVLRNISY